MLDFTLILCCKSCVSEYVNYIMYTLDLVRLDFHAKKLYLQFLLVKQSTFYTSKYSNFQWFRSVNTGIIRVVAVLLDLSDVF